MNIYLIIFLSILLICIVVIFALVFFKKQKNILAEKGQYTNIQPSLNGYTLISSKEHFTSKFKSKNNDLFVVRRGQPFIIEGDSSKDIKIFRLDNKNSKISMKTFTEAENALLKDYLNPKLEYTPTNQISFRKISNNQIEFTTPPDASIGEYRIQIDGINLKVFLLFNPYFDKDQVYFPDKNLLKEYIENEKGYVFKGTFEKPEYILWDYGQFEYETLIATFFLLSFLEAFIDYDSTSPVSVCKGLTFAIPARMVNGSWETNSQINWLKKDSNFISCNKETDCGMVGNLCIQPPARVLKNHPEEGYFPKVCGYVDKKAMEDTSNKMKQSDYIPPIQSNYYESCKVNDDCKKDIPKPKDIENLVEWEKRCIHAKSCGLDYFGVNIVYLWPAIISAINSDDTITDKKKIKDMIDEWTTNYNNKKETILKQTDISEEQKNIKLQMNRWEYVDKLTNFIVNQSLEFQNLLKSYTFKTQSPNYWSNSLELLEQFLIQKDSTQKISYVQCWVIAAITTSICRVLGIPCRQVVAYNAFHEKCEESKDKNECKKSSSHIYTGVFNGSNGHIWSFHNWNDVWMSRPDLPNEYKESDWQTIDSTPQELSGGAYRLGPANLKMIRETDMIGNYDVSFVRAEVKYKILNEENQLIPTTASLLTSKPLVSNLKGIETDISDNITSDYISFKSEMLAALSTPTSDVSINISDDMIVNITSENIITAVDIIGRLMSYNGVVFDEEPIYNVTKDSNSKNVKIKLDKNIADSYKYITSYIKFIITITDKNNIKNKNEIIFFNKK